MFDLSIDEDYYKPIIARGAFNDSYIQYESKGDKGKNLSIKEYLNMIKPYLDDIINDHKTRGLERYYSGNKACVEDTSSEWKIQLAIAINFISSKDSGVTRTMHTKSNNVEIMIGSETDERKVDHRHAKRVFKSLNNKNLGDHHDLFVQSDTLLLADVFENFRNMCIKVYELDPAHFLSAPGLAWQVCLRKTEVKLESLTDVDLSLVVEKGIRGRIWHAMHRYAKANNKYVKDYNKY